MQTEKEIWVGRDFPDFQIIDNMLTLDLYHVFRIMNFQTMYAKNISLYSIDKLLTNTVL